MLDGCFLLSRVEVAFLAYATKKLVELESYSRLCRHRYSAEIGVSKGVKGRRQQVKSLPAENPESR